MHQNVFTFNNVIYEQIDRVSMGSWLPAKNIFTELAIKVVDNPFKDSLLKFYIR